MCTVNSFEGINMDPILTMITTDEDTRLEYRNVGS